jgi:hypothetical protein
MIIRWGGSDEAAQAEGAEQRPGDVWPAAQAAPGGVHGGCERGQRVGER